MVANFFRFIIIGITLAAITATLYLNVIVIPEGHAGILSEKTTGAQMPPLEPGYHWLWSGFVPEKWTLKTIDRNPQPVEVKVIEPLRYAQFLPEKDYFSIQVGLRINYNLPNSAIEYFLKYFNGDFTQLPRYVKERTQIVIQMALLEFYRGPQDLPQVEQRLRLRFFENGEFESKWNEVFGNSGLELEWFDITTIEAPDREIYLEQIRDQDRIFEAKREALIQNIMAEAQTDSRRLQDQADLEKAEKMAGLIAKYPDLLEYYKIEKLYQSANITIVDSNSELSNPSGNGKGGVRNRGGAQSGASDSGSIPPITR